MNIARVFADEAGETHLGVIELATESEHVRSLANVPTTTLTVTEMHAVRESRGFHPPPRRQLLIVLRGAFEVGTTGGETRRFGVGETLVVDDVDSRGHTFTDIGEDPLITVQVGIPEDWRWPGT